MLLCLAERVGDDYRLSVRPTALPPDHPLARMGGDEMGIVYHTDIGGRSCAYHDRERSGADGGGDAAGYNRDFHYVSAIDH